MCCSFTSLGGPRPHAHPAGVRQIVTCDNNVLDRQIVAWPAVHGHRHRPVDNLKYFLPRLNSAVLVWEIVGCQFNNNGGEYGITIRLHSLGHRRMDRGATRLSCKLLLDHDVFRHQGCYSGECGRDYFPDYVSSNVGSWTMGYKNSSFRGEGKSSKLDWLQNQHQRGTTFQVYSKMDKSWSGFTGGKIRKEYRFKIVSTSNPGRSSAWVFLCIYKYKRIKEQAQAH
jgi:hypothetical protein